MIKNIRQKIKYLDLYLFIPYVILCMIGVVMVYSASSINLSYADMAANSYLSKQLVFAFLGIFCTLVATHINPSMLVSNKLMGIGYGVVLLGLVWARMSGAVNGAAGWINMGPISIQPSEFCKLFLSLYCARLLAQREQRIYLRLPDPAPVWGKLTAEHIRYIAIAGLLLLILIEPDLGGFMINSCIVLILWLASRRDYRWSVKVLGGLALGVILLSQLMRFFNPFSGRLEYMYRRFTAYFNPFQYSNAEGKQLVNSYYAISNGGFIGRGLGNSIQKRGYLPEPYTDFILSVIAEEIGFIGTLVVLSLLAWIICRIILIGIRSKNTYNSLVCYGIGTFMMAEALFNIGGVSGLIPITGVTLPFVSYGGSSMIVLSLSLGIVMNISANQRRNREIDLISATKDI